MPKTTLPIEIKISTVVAISTILHSADLEAIDSALAQMTGGVSDTYKITDPSMFSIDKVKSLTLPAYAGPTPNRFAKPAPEHKAEQAQKQSEDAAEADRQP